MSSQVYRLPFQHRCIVFSQHGGRGFPPIYAVLVQPLGQTLGRPSPVWHGIKRGLPGHAGEPGCSCSRSQECVSHPCQSIAADNSKWQYNESGEVESSVVLWCATLTHSVYQWSGPGEEGGWMLPSKTYIKEGLWMGISVSSHAKLFVDLNAFGLSAYLASLCSDYHEFQTEKRSWFFLAHYYKMFCLHFSKMVAQKMTSHVRVLEKAKKKGFGFRWESRKVSTFSWLIDFYYIKY